MLNIAMIIHLMSSWIYCKAFLVFHENYSSQYLGMAQSNPRYIIVDVRNYQHVNTINICGVNFTACLIYVEKYSPIIIRIYLRIQFFQRWQLNAKRVARTWWKRDLHHVNLRQVNSSPPGVAYLCRVTGTAFVHAMAWRRTADKPLPETMLTYYQLDPLGTNVSETWIKILPFSFKKMRLKMLSAKMMAILSRGMIWWFNNNTSKHNNAISIFYENCCSWTYPDCDGLHFFMCSGVLTCMYIDIPCINQKEASLS